MSSTAPTSPPPSPPPPPAPTPPTGTVRRTGDRVVGGVAAALGRSWGIDPVLVRILFIVGTFAAGIGALLYLVLWIFLPLVDAPPPPDSPVHDRGPAFWLGAGVVTVGGIITLAGLPARNILVPLALVALGVALWQRPGTSETAPGETPPHAVGTTPPTATTATTSAAGAPTNATWEPPPVPGHGSPAGADAPASTIAPTAWRHTPEVRWWTPPAPRPRPSWLGPITVAVALVATGVVALLGQAGVLQVRGTDLLAAALLVVAGGLVVGAFRGRAKWLSLPAVALAGFLVVAQGVSGLGVILSPTVGLRTVQASDLAEPLDVRHGVGELVVDVTAADLADPSPVDIDLVAGQVQVGVPEDARVELHVTVGVGAITSIADATLDEEGFLEVDRQELAAGRRLDVDRVLEPDGAVGGTLVLDIAVAVGEVEVYRGDETFDLGRTFTGEDHDHDSFGPPGEAGSEFSMEFDLGLGGTATEDLATFRGYADAASWFYAESCPGGDLDDEVLAGCLDRLVPSQPPLIGEGHSLREQFFEEECATARIVDDPGELLEPCLRLVANPIDEPNTTERSPVPSEGGN